MACKFCGRPISGECMNTRDMEDCAISGDDTCFNQLALAGGGEYGLASIIAKREAARSYEE